MAIVELVGGFEITTHEFGVTAQRQWLEGDDVAGSDDLPVIGDSLWDNMDYTNAENELGVSDEAQCIICRTLNNKAYDNNINNTLWTATYTNDMTDFNYWEGTGASAVISELPVSIEASGDSEILQLPAGVVTNWFDDKGNPINGLPIPYRVTMGTLRVNRFLTNAGYANLQGNALTMMGTVNGFSGSQWSSWGGGYNEGNGFLSQIQGGWLFTGVTSEPHFGVAPTSSTDDYQQFHVCEYTFVLRAPARASDPHQYATNGWNSILRVDGQGWDVPINGADEDESHPYIYNTSSSDFAELWG